MRHTKKEMLQCLPVDVWSILIRFLSFDDVCQCRETCVHVWNALSHLEWEVAVIMSETVLNDTTFWPRAYRRPIKTSAGLETWHAEVVRVHRRRRRDGGSGISSSSSSPSSSSSSSSPSLSSSSLLDEYDSESE